MEKFRMRNIGMAQKVGTQDQDGTVIYTHILILILSKSMTPAL